MKQLHHYCRCRKHGKVKPPLSTDSRPNESPAQLVSHPRATPIGDVHLIRTEVTGAKYTDQPAGKLQNITGMSDLRPLTQEYMAFFQKARV